MRNFGLGVGAVGQWGSRGIECDGYVLLSFSEPSLDGPGASLEICDIMDAAKPIAVFNKFDTYTKSHERYFQEQLRAEENSANEAAAK